MHIYREFRAELHEAYKKLEKGHDPKQCPYDMQRVAQWIWLIENKWETPKWKVAKLYLMRVWVCVGGLLLLVLLLFLDFLSVRGLN